MSTFPTTSESKDSFAYKRGVVLGLTMAEVLLILLFCLLIPLAIVYDSLRNEKRETERIPSYIRETENFENLTRMHSLLENCDLLDRLQEDTFMVLLSDCIESKDPVKNKEAILAEHDEFLKELQNFGEDFKQNNNLTSEETIKLLSDDAYMDLIADLTSCFEYKTDIKADEEYMMLLSEVNECLEEKLPVEEENEPEGDKPDWPPIIEISEASGYSFESGQSKLSDEFKKLLEEDVIEKIVGSLIDYDANVVEVIGHTDLQPVASTSVTNLDSNLQLFLSGDISIDQLYHSDNSGLGMARAVSVAKVLIEGLEKRNDVSDTIVLPYSGAQIISPNETLSINTGIEGDQAEQLVNSERRRIEIRVRRSEKH